MLFPRTGSYSPILENGEEIVILFMERQEKHKLIKCSLDSLWLLIQFQLGGCDREEHEARFQKKKEKLEEVKADSVKTRASQPLMNHLCGGEDHVKIAHCE